MFNQPPRTVDIEEQKRIPYRRANRAPATPVGSVSKHSAASDQASGDALAGRSGTGGLHPVAQPLRLDYMGLKRRLEGVPVARKKATTPAFVELIAAHPAAVAECVIEFESRIGSKLRIQWKGSAAPDWASLLRAWREAER
jgi:hypothetical protein